MKWGKWLEQWDMKSLKIKAPFLEMEWNPQDEDKNAAWELYIELLTRITTQPLYASLGDEKAALESIYTIFPLTREVIKKNGRYCIGFTKIAIVVLNQVIRPFTAKWHKLTIQGSFSNVDECEEFRRDLYKLQVELILYTKMLGAMADIEEDLTELEEK